MSRETKGEREMREGEREGEKKGEREGGFFLTDGAS